jgi:translocation and assembly module TamA
VFLCLLILLSGPHLLAAESPNVLYQVIIEGVDDKDLRSLLEQVSESKELIERPPASLTNLRRRAREDEPRLLTALQSRGYYGAKVESVVESDQTPARVVFRVIPGPIYRLRSIGIDVGGPDGGFIKPRVEEIGLQLGKPAVSRSILTAETRLLEKAREQSFALAKLARRRAVVDHGTREMDVEFRIEPGSKARLGPVRFVGIENVDEDFVRKRVPWTPGDPYSPALLEKARQAMIGTGLFTTARLRTAAKTDDQGWLPITIEVTERKHRSVSAGLGFRTDEGPGGMVGWEHRNFFGSAERVRLEADVSVIAQSLDASIRKPEFLNRKQSLIGELSFTRKETDAFDSLSVSTSLGLERVLAPGMIFSSGLAFKASEIDQESDTDSFGLFSVPVKFGWDRSDNLLDPTRNGRLLVEGAPYMDTFGSGVFFGKLLVRYSHYFRLFKKPRLVFAARSAVGSLIGEERDSIPADERFYAGGGGSVRGYGFQLASPLDGGDDPIGGRSLFELSSELRLRVTKSIGIVTFADAGGAFKSSFPTFGDELRVGVGGGLRYITRLGPLRFDVGFPVDKREDVDDNFQIYVSIGQAF